MVSTTPRVRHVTIEGPLFVVEGPTAGGHNAGIVSEPGHHRRSFRVATKKLTDHYVDPDSYYANTPVKEGSWWPEWVSWLKDRSGPPVSAAPAAAELGPASVVKGTTDGQLSGPAVSAQVLPVLPLKNTVLFPMLFLPLNVGRPNSVAAVACANRRASCQCWQLA